MTPPVILHWLRNDLRLHDNEPLAWGAGHGSAFLPVYCFDPRQFGRTRLGFPRMGPFRARFLLESLADLRASLRELGSDLATRQGEPEKVIARLAAQCGARVVVAHAETTSEETAVEARLRDALAASGCELRLFWGSTLVHRDDLPFDAARDLPDAFADFHRLVGRHWVVRPPMSVPRAFPPVPNVPPGRIPEYDELGVSAPSPEPLAPFDFHGGEAAGFQRLVTWMWSGNFLRTFKETRDGLGSANNSSLFSPWLSHGCLSPRFIHAQAQEYEKRRVANESTTLLATELLRRDFFRFVSVRHGNRLFQGRGLRLPGASESHRGRERFEAWHSGATGIPFIDANMREMRRTGFLSSRGRQAAASYLVHDLGLDWRMGAEWFESQLIDYDPCSNYGNWQRIAGAGPDPSPVPRLDPLEQARIHDPDAAYVKHWIPRLADLPADAAHTPWILPPEERAAFGLRPRDYPSEPTPSEPAIRQ